jgi:hypothetical protein
MPRALWQTCGSIRKPPTACAENHASGKGIRDTGRLKRTRDGKQPAGPLKERS